MVDRLIKNNLRIRVGLGNTAAGFPEHVHRVPPNLGQDDVPTTSYVETGVLDLRSRLEQGGNHFGTNEILHRIGAEAEIGSCSNSHPVLSSPAQDGLERVKAESRENLCGVIGFSSASFGYLCNSCRAYGHDVFSVAKLAGHKGAVCTAITVNRYAMPRSGPRRTPIYDSEGLDKALVRVADTYNWICGFQKIWARFLAHRSTRKNNP